LFWRGRTRYDSCVPRKKPHTLAEVSALADRLRMSRPEGMPIEAWLTEKHAELRSMTRGSRSWSWDEIAVALNMAGITYRAGIARADGGTSRGRWTALQLQNKIRAIRERELARRPTASASDTDAVAAVIEALVRRGVLAASHDATTSLSNPDARRDAIRQLAAPLDTSAPVSTPPVTLQAQPSPNRIRVFGDIEPEPQKELSPLERMQAEKAARTQAVIDEWKKKGG